MPIMNPNRNRLHLKIVYYGPSLAGKTATLRYIHSRLGAAPKPPLTVVDLKGDHTLPFECLCLSLETIPDWPLQVQLVTVPGRRQFNAGRKLLLRGVQGVVFVADSCVRQRQKNLASLENLKENLSWYNISLHQIPLVFQLHKRDLAGDDLLVMPTPLMLDDLCPKPAAPAFPTSAITGEGILEALKRIINLSLAPLAARPAA